MKAYVYIVAAFLVAGPLNAQKVSLVHEAGHAALSDAAGSLKIYDATLVALNRKAAGLPHQIAPSGIIGMPKITYGIARGQLLLRNTTAPSLGATTGSGAVGTGTHAGSMGTSGHSPGVNGKSPDAGPSLYGIPPYGGPPSPQRLVRQ